MQTSRLILYEMRCIKYEMSGGVKAHREDTMLKGLTVVQEIFAGAQGVPN